MKTEYEIFNCPPDAKIPCPLEWDALTPTDDEAVRVCPKCGESVFLCKTDEEAIAHAKQGHCVALAVVHESELPEMHLDIGPDIMITPEQSLALHAWRVEKAKRRALKNTRYADRDCETCGFPLAPWRKSCWVCEAIAEDPEENQKKLVIWWLKSLNGRVVSLSFSDSCSMEVRIVETMHLEEGGDFAADVLKVNCKNLDHRHPKPGDCINIRRKDIVSLEPRAEG
jgi:hypothetical protein